LDINLLQVLPGNVLFCATGIHGPCRVSFRTSY
jgi:hypothetical protein